MRTYLLFTAILATANLLFSAEPDFEIIGKPAPSITAGPTIPPVAAELPNTIEEERCEECDKECGEVIKTGPKLYIFNSDKFELWTEPCLIVFTSGEPPLKKELLDLQNAGYKVGIAEVKIDLSKLDDPFESKLLKHYKIPSVPYFASFRDSKLVDSVDGNKADLGKLVDILAKTVSKQTSKTGMRPPSTIIKHIDQDSTTQIADGFFLLEFYDATNGAPNIMMDERLEISQQYGWTVRRVPVHHNKSNLAAACNVKEFPSYLMIINGTIWGRAGKTTAPDALNELLTRIINKYNSQPQQQPQTYGSDFDESQWSPTFGSQPSSCPSCQGRNCRR